MNTRKGFTLVELLVVIAILAILATVSVVGYTSFITDANNSVAMQELTQIRDAVIAEDINNNSITLNSTGLLYKGTGDTAADAITAAEFKALVESLNLGLTFTDSSFTVSGAVITYTAPNGGVATWDTASGKVVAQ